MPAYPVRLISQRGGWGIYCRDLPEAVTAGTTRTEALRMASAALRVTAWYYELGGRALPEPSRALAGEVMVEMAERDEPEVASCGGRTRRIPSPLTT